MRQHAIYTTLGSDTRKSPAACGGRDRLTQTIYVGTSSRNSHELADIEVTRRELPDGEVEFALYVGNEMIKRGILRGKEFEIDSELDVSREDWPQRQAN